MIPELETIARTAALTFVALVPGASAAAGFEWHSVRYGRRRKDWVLRLLLFSGLWLAVGFWVWHWLAMNYWADFVALQPVPWYVNFIPTGFVVVPYALGWSMGWLTARSPRRVRWLLGGNRTPTAWDHLFEQRAIGLLRCRLRSGRWVGGLYIEHEPVTSYAATDEDDRDLYLARTILLDQETAAPVLRDGVPVETSGGILLQRSDIESLEFIPLEELASAGVDDEP